MISKPLKTVLGVDLGTQSLKLVFYEYQHQEVAEVVAKELTVDRDASGKAEQNPLDWLAAFYDCLERTPDDVKASVQAIGVSGQQHGLVVLNDKGEVLAPAKLWCDTSTQKEVDDINLACGGDDALLKATGNLMVTGYTAPKILWLKRNRPDAYNQMTRILLPHDYLNYVMTGDQWMEFGDASGTGFFDIRRRQWADSVLNAIDPNRNWNETLPPLRSYESFAGSVDKNFANRTGIPEDTPVSVGGGDNMMGAIETGNVAPGKFTMSLGSSGTIYTYSAQPVADQSKDVAAFCSSNDGWLPLICTMNCTFGTELIRSLLSIDIHEMDERLEEVEAGSGGLLVIPFFNGERVPNLPNAKGSILGIDSGNCSPNYLMRATVEGVTYALKYGLDQLVELGLDANEIILTGGGKNSIQWQQIVADVCDLPVRILPEKGGASFGAALQALWTLKRKEAVLEATPTEDCSEIIPLIELVDQHTNHNSGSLVKPIKERVEVYQKQYLNYLQAVETLTVNNFNENE